MDVLSDIVAALRVRSTGLATMRLTAPWGIGTSDRPATGIFVVLDGGCFVESQGLPPIELDAGDIVLLASGGGATLHSGDQTQGLPLERVWAQDVPLGWSPGCPASRLRLIEHGGGGTMTTLLALSLSLHGDDHSLPADLPGMVRIDHREALRFPWLGTALDLVRMEAVSGGEGTRAVGARLAELLFVYILRAHFALHPAEASGWKSGAHDARIARALGAIHSAPQRSWTVTGLAQEAAMSRSAFAERFGALVGQPPLEYLTARRMDLAAARLARGEACLQLLARDLGYRSQHAFSHAFKRNRGVAPAEYRRRARLASRTE